MNAMLIAIAVSCAFRGLLGLRDILVPIELRFDIGPMPIWIGTQDLLLGLLAGFLAGSKKRAVSDAGESTAGAEANLVQRYERTYRTYRNWGLVVFGLALLGGGHVIANGLQTGWTGWTSRTWPQIEGTIVESKVTFTSRTEQHQVDSRRPEETVTRTHETFFPSIKYEFELDGRKFEGTRITASDTGMTSQEAATQTKQYPPGARTVVFYNPQNPADSVLVPGIATTSILSIVFGSIWCLFCILTIKYLLLSNFAKRMILEFVRPPGIHLSDDLRIPLDSAAKADTSD